MKKTIACLLLLIPFFSFADSNNMFGDKTIPLKHTLTFQNSNSTHSVVYVNTRIGSQVYATAQGVTSGSKTSITNSGAAPLEVYAYATKQQAIAAAGQNLGTQQNVLTSASLVSSAQSSTFKYS